jgi:hypothetical protein
MARLLLSQVATTTPPCSPPTSSTTLQSKSPHSALSSVHPRTHVCATAHCTDLLSSSTGLTHLRFSLNLLYIYLDTKPAPQSLTRSLKQPSRRSTTPSPNGRTSARRTPPSITSRVYFSGPLSSMSVCSVSLLPSSLA